MKGLNFLQSWFTSPLVTRDGNYDQEFQRLHTITLYDTFLNYFLSCVQIQFQENKVGQNFNFYNVKFDLNDSSLFSSYEFNSCEKVLNV